MLEIQSDIPVPKARNAPELAATMRELLPGQSFLWPKARRGQIQGMVWRWSNNPMYPGREYVTRTEGENIRVWRTK